MSKNINTTWARGVALPDRELVRRLCDEIDLLDVARQRMTKRLDARDEAIDAARRVLTEWVDPK